MPLTTYDALAVASTLPQMEFRELGTFGAGHCGVFQADAGGPSPWEMHPDCDELLHILAGTIEVEVLPEDGAGEVVTLATGSALIVPQGCWHRQTLLEASVEYYVTPGQTLHSMAADPRHED